MRCETFETRLQQLLDERALPGEDVELQQHAADCPGCRAILEAEQRLFDGLALAEIPELGAEFARSVLAQLPPPAKRRKRNRLTTWRVVGLTALAATLLLAAALTVWNRAGSQQSQLAAGRTGGPASPQPTERAAAAPTSDRTALLPTWWMQDPEELYPDELRARHRQQVDRIADDLRPLTSSFTAAAAALRRTIPVGKSRQTTRRPQARAPSSRHWPDVAAAGKRGVVHFLRQDTQAG